MSNLVNFLESLSEHELLKFYEFRYTQFLPASKNRIDQELLNRGIDLNSDPNMNFEAVELLNLNKNNVFCPRCLSSKFFNSTEIETVSYSYASVDLEVDYRTCVVCLYSEERNFSQESEGFVGPFQFIRTLINRKR